MKNIERFLLIDAGRNFLVKNSLPLKIALGVEVLFAIYQMEGKKTFSF